jgi:hypothetical protein
MQFDPYLPTERCLIFSGRLPIWFFGHLCNSACNKFPWLAAYDTNRSKAPAPRAEA